MSITLKRKTKEIRTQGVISYDITGADVGKTYDFMGVADGFRILDVNVTVDEKFANTNNTIGVGIEDDFTRFIADTSMDSVKGIGFNNRQFKASAPTSLVMDIKGSASATGKATITVVYAKLPDVRQNY